MNRTLLFAVTSSLLCLIAVPAHAASLEFHTTAVSALPGTVLSITPERVPAIDLYAVQGKSSIGIEYRNLPPESRISLEDSNGDPYEGAWSLSTGSSTSGRGSVGLPAHLPRGSYTLVATTMSGTNLLAQSQTFRSSGNRIVLVGSAYQKGTLHVFIGTQKYEQMLDLTRDKAKRACKAIERANDGSEVTCVWNGKSL